MPTLEDLALMGPDVQQAVIDHLLSEERTRQQGLMGARDSAFSAFQNAQQQPAPDLGPASGVEQLFGDVATVLSRRPEFAQRTRENIQTRQAQAIQRRTENLTMLRDKYLEQAALVGKFDSVKEIELRQAAEKQAKLIDQLHETAQTQLTNEAAMKRTQAEQAGAMERTNVNAQNAIDVANINSQAEVMRWMAAESGKTGTRLTAKDRTERLAAIDGQFIDNKKGLLKGNAGIYRAAMLAVPPRTDQSELQWTQEMAQKLMSIRGDKKIRPQDVQAIREARAQHFAPAEAGPPATGPGANPTLGPNQNPLTTPAVEVPGTPPDAALELIDEANQLINTELNATGGMAAARRQQAEARLKRIQYILNTKYNLKFILPTKQGEGTVGGITVKGR